MQRDYFQKLEKLPHNTPLELAEVIDQLAFSQDGLLPVITQDAISKEVLMFAWMNKQSLELTIETQRVTYWSRSRNELWIKGETSGHTQRLVSIAFDCDGDVVLCQVEQSGPACHTGRPNCFYLNVDTQSNKIFIVGDAPEV